MLPTSGRNTIQECHLLGPGPTATGSAGTCPSVGVRRQAGHFSLWQGFSSFPRLGGHASLLKAMRKAVSRKRWLVLHNLVVSGMRNSERISTRKAYFLNGSLHLPPELVITPLCYSMGFSKSPQELSASPC